MRTGIVGSGAAARFHYDAIRRVHDNPVEVVGVYSPTAAHRERFARERGIVAVASLEALLDQVDVVHVCTPPMIHESVTVAALQRGVHAIVEKPFTGYFGPGNVGERTLDGDSFPREEGLAAAIASCERILAAERASDATVCYAENWVYAPAVQKEAEILRATGGQILWMLGVTGHSGSHSANYGIWAESGGGSIMGKGVHPLSAALYLKQVEGLARGGQAIRPVAVSGRVHALTRLPGFRDEGHLRTGYTDVEDFGALHVVFEDGTCADLFGTEVILGGVTNTLEVHANNHRARCNINPNTALETFNPRGAAFDDIYVVEKIGTKEGWAFTSPDEPWFTGYQHEIDAFYRALVAGTPPESGAGLGADPIAVVYAGYLSAERAGAEVSITATRS